MRHAARGRLSVFALTGVLACAPAARCADGAELDQYEEKCVVRAAERALKAGKSDRAHWLTELEGAYPGKVVAALTEDEYATWYDLLAGKNEDWRRDAAPTPQVAELFDKVAQRMELGPVPNIRREEFKKYAKKVLREQNPPTEERDANEDADKAFRAIDRSGDGELDRDELTAGLKDEKFRADADGNGRISKDEYRDYFRKKVATRVVVLVAKSGDAVRGPDGKPTGRAGAALPEWFAALDLDKDGQVSLFEWRKGTRPTAVFTEMDLNGDGLLTRDEYARYIKMSEDALKQKTREDDAKKP